MASKTNQTLINFGFKRKTDENNDDESKNKQTKVKGRDVTKKSYEQKRSRLFQEPWLDKFVWLEYDSSADLMYCKFCRKYPETADVTSSLFIGTNNFRIETLKFHGGGCNQVGSKPVKPSEKHLKCEQKYILEEKKKSKTFESTTSSGQNQLEIGPMDRLIKQLGLKQLKKLSYCFRTAYFVVKKELPFTLYPSLLHLQELNGLQLPTSYRSDNACRRFVEYIKSSITDDISNLLQKSRCLSVLFDGATDVSVIEHEIVYARILHDGKPKNVYVKLEAIEHAHAEGVGEAVQRAMISTNNQDWKQKLVATGSDGASVNVGRRHSVTSILAEDVESLIVMHCINHRLELGVLSAIKERDAAQFNNLIDILQKIHKHYHYSSKAVRELQAIAEAMVVKYYKPGNLKGTRWMPHMKQACEVLVKNYNVIIAHFESIAASGKGSPEVVGRAKFLLKALRNYKTLYFINSLLDCLASLARFSLRLQDNDATLSDALDSLETLNIEFIGYTQRPGEHLQNYIDLVQLPNGLFRDVQLTHLPPNDPTEAVDYSESLKQQLQSLIDTIMNHVNSRCKDIDTGPFLKKMKVFFPINWPQETAALAIYGENEILSLADHFRLLLQRMGCNFQVLKTEWQTLKVIVNSMGRQVFDEEKYARLFRNANQSQRLHNILMLVEIILVIPVSTAVCERGFSAMKRIKSDWRSNLTPEMTNSLMCIALEGPDYDTFQAEEAVNRWWWGSQRQRRPEFDEADVFSVSDSRSSTD